jgi:hypothetical protein
MTLTYKSEPIVVIAHAPDWNSNVSLVVEHNTRVFETLDLSEDRMRTRPRPLYGIKYNTLNLTGQQQGTLRKQFELSQGKPVGVPLWTEAVFLTATEAAGSTELAVTSTSATLFQVFNYAIIWADWNSYEIVELTAVAANLLTLDAATENEWPAGTMVMPFAIGHAKRPDFTGHSTDVSSVPIEFMEVFNRALNQKGTLDAA